MLLDILHSCSSDIGISGDMIDLEKYIYKKCV